MCEVRVSKRRGAAELDPLRFSTAVNLGIISSTPLSCSVSGIDADIMLGALRCAHVTDKRTNVCSARARACRGVSLWSVVEAGCDK